MSSKRILVVDDDPDLLFLVAHGIKSLSPEFQVSTAPGASSALQQVRQQTFDLVITDYMMPGRSGLDLVTEARTISPDTRFVMMTAHHDTGRVRNHIQETEVDGFISKPFILPELLEVIQKVTQRESTNERAVSSGSSGGPRRPPGPVREKLIELRRHTGAHSVVLIGANGSPVQSIGEHNAARAARLSAFVSSNFLAVMELSTLFGDNDASFKSSYFEGTSYNIYAYNINGDYFLAVIFNADIKPGSVWFYTKQIAADLFDLLPAPASSISDEEDLTIARDFEDLLGNGD